jgi:uridylate kinase
MPRMPECYIGNVIATSIGGSVLFSKEHPELNRDFFGNLIVFLHDQISAERSVVMIVGGGILARIRQEDAKFFGVTDKSELDQIGLGVTVNNANYISDILISNGMPVEIYNFTSELKPGVYPRGGKDPGHTSDYVAVQAAVKTGCCVVFNVSTNPGIFAFTENGFDSTRLLSEITYDEYLPHIPEHIPGENYPFDRNSTLLAQAHDLTVVLVGPDLDNLKKCLNGEEFVGTVMHS